MLRVVPNFWWQVLLSVIDKLLLGTAALGVGYYINLRLERFRASRALEGEYVKERTRRLDELYVLMLDVEDAARDFTHLEMDRIERGKVWPRDMAAAPMPTLHSERAYEVFRDLSLTLTRKASHFRPWIGDSLQIHCADYAKVVHDSVTEQTVAGSHNIDRIGQLEDRARDLQAEIMAAIRVGAPHAAIDGSSNRALAVAGAAGRKRLSAGKRS